MRYVCVSLILLGILVRPALSEAASPGPRIVEIRGQVHGAEAKVHFVLRDAFSPEMIEALKSGIEVSFQTVVRIERVHKNWFDVTVGDVRFSRSVRYDSLSRVYHLHRGGRQELLPDLFTALSGMTDYEVAVPLREPAVPGKRYRARVRTRLDRVGLSEPLRSIFFFSSIWDLETGWERGDLSAP